jgi:hypothetical protein
MELYDHCHRGSGYHLYLSGTKAVNVTQKQQMFVYMLITFFSLHFLPNEMTFSNALHIAGANDKMNIVNFSIDPEENTP